jgi:hypothetical protein
MVAVKFCLSVRSRHRESSKPSGLTLAAREVSLYLSAYAFSVGRQQGPIDEILFEFGHFVGSAKVSQRL